MVLEIFSFYIQIYVISAEFQSRLSFLGDDIFVSD